MNRRAGGLPAQRPAPCRRATATQLRDKACASARPPPGHGAPCPYISTRGRRREQRLVIAVVLADEFENLFHRRQVQPIGSALRPRRDEDVRVFDGDVVLEPLFGPPQPLDG